MVKAQTIGPVLGPGLLQWHATHEFPALNHRHYLGLESWECLPTFLTLLSFARMNGQKIVGMGVIGEGVERGTRKERVITYKGMEK